MCISSKFQPEEKILRIVFHPQNFTDGGKPKSNIFRSRKGEDEVSVIRYDYTNPDFCKNYGKKIQNPPKTNFYGFALILVKEITKTGSEIIFTPRKKKKSRFYNPYHADIKIGYVCTKGEPLPAEYQYKVDEMKEKARLYKDGNPKSECWKGEKDLV